MGCLGIVRVFAANVFDGKAARQLITVLFSFRWCLTCSDELSGEPYKMTVG